MNSTILQSSVFKFVSETITTSGSFFIRPFIETPAIDKQINESVDRSSITAADLFSLFTADIIQKDVVFTK